MLDFYQTLRRELEQSPIVLATVTRVRGSVPREIGAKMIVCSDGRIVGTIGGGAGEAKVLVQALRVLESGHNTFVDIDLSGAANRDTQGICGGTMQVWLERWERSALAIVDQILSWLQSGQRGTLVTPWDASKPSYLLPTATDTVQVTSAEMLEPLQLPPTLLIVGAGHVAVPLAQVAHLAGFQVVVVDDRPEFASVQRFPTAQVLAQPVAIALRTLPTPAFVALVTRGFQHDLDALQALLGFSTEYIGMIGSQKRVRFVLQTLLEKGYSPEAVQKIYAPIGLDIGALTPEEIAVSIGAELIKVRRGGTGRSLSKIKNDTTLDRKCDRLQTETITE